RRRDTLCAGLRRAGWEVDAPRGTMFLWAPVPEPHRAEGSLSFALRLAREADVAVTPGVGFGDGGEGHVRFALVENEQRIAQATRQIRRFLEPDTLYSEAWPRSGSHPSSAPTQPASAPSSSRPQP